MSEHQLKKSVTFIESIAIVIGLVIGSGIFLKPSIVLKNTGSPGMSIVAWVVGGLITLCAALTIAEIAAAIPKLGGLYTYLEELYGETWAFLYGWVEAVISFPGSSAALAIAFATFSTFFIPMTPMQQKLLAIAMIIILITMNIIATKFGGVIQTLSTIGKLIPMLAIIVIGLVSGTAHDMGFSSSGITGGSGFGAAILGVLWAFDGWVCVSYMAGEIEEPQKKVPRAIVAGVLIVLAVYVTFNLAIFNVLPAGKVAVSEKIGTDVAVMLFGNGGAAFITIGIMISVFGALNGNLMTGARIPFAMGERKQLPYSNFLSKVHPKFKTPANSLIFLGVLSIIYVISGSFNTLTDLCIFVLWIFFTSGVLGVFILRKKLPSEKRPYKVPLYPIVPILGLTGGTYLMYSTIRSSFKGSMLGIGLTIIGLPIYYYLKKKYSLDKNKNASI